MEFFNRLFPNTPIWIINVGAGSIVPEGLYTFVEFYCGNPECRCEAGTFDLVKIDATGKILGERIAAIYYGWAEPDSDENPRIENSKLQSKLTMDALELFKKSIQEYDYINLIKAHYQMVKDYFIKNPTHWVPGSINNEKPGRNDPCICGSGKKYKRCCLTK